MESRAKVEPGSGKHSVYTHFPKESNCDICLKTKTTRASCRTRAGTVVPRAEHSGDLIAADHKVLSEESESRSNHRYAVVVQDLATQWIQSYPCETRTSQETQKSLMKFLEPTRKRKDIYTDNSWNLASLARNYPGIIVRQRHTDQKQMGLLKEQCAEWKKGTPAVLLQSGLAKEWRADSMECHCYLRNIQDLLSDGKTPYERRFGMPFDGPAIPFGAMVEYHPISSKDQSRLRQFGAKVLPGIFLGYALYAGGIWKGGIMVADIEELEEMDASELHARRLNAKVVLTPQRSGNFIFPVADGTVKIFGRRTASDNIHLSPGASGTRRGTRSFSRRTRRTLFSKPSSRWLNTGRCGSQKMILGLLREKFIYRHHVVLRDTSCTYREKKHFLFQWSASTLPEQHMFHRMYCWRKMLMITGTWMEKKNYLMHGQASQDSSYWDKTISRPDNVWPDMWERIADASKKEAKQRWTIEKPKLDNAWQLRWIFFIGPNDEEFNQAHNESLS